jgi:hypothetical protein
MVEKINEYRKRGKGHVDGICAERWHVMYHVSHPYKQPPKVLFLTATSYGLQTHTKETAFRYGG